MATAAAEPAREPVDQAAGDVQGRAANAPKAATARPAAPMHAPVHVIEPWKPGVFARLREVWSDRRLLPYYSRCYIQRRYKNTWLGWIWLPLKPGLDMLSKALFFGGFLGVSSGDRPYIIFFTFGTCGWVLFESLTRWGARGVRMSNQFIKGAYAPRLPRTVSLVGTAAFDLFLYTIVAFAAVFYYLVTTGTLYVTPSKQVAVAGAGLVLLTLWGLTVALFMAPLSTYAKDARYSFNYVTQFWYFLTPIAYPISSIPPQYQPIAEANPLTAPVEMVKYGFLQTAPPTTKSLATCLIGLAVLGSLSLWLFTRMERVAVQRL
jgi:homopolymeric O-antigen transport system permease protein